MALRNFFFNGSYGVVDNVLYSKQQCSVRFDFVLFENETKKTEVRRIPYQLVAKRDVAKAFSFVNALPESPNEGDTVVIDFGNYTTIRNEYLAFEKTRVKPPEVVRNENDQITNQAELDEYQQYIATFDRLKEHNKRLATWDGVAEQWQYIQPAENALIKCDNTRYVFRDNSWVQVNDVFDEDTFEEHFGLPKMNGDNKNIIAITYNWLKTRPESANTVDA